MTLILEMRPPSASMRSPVNEVGAPQAKARTERKKKPNNIGADEISVSDALNL